MAQSSETVRKERYPNGRNKGCNIVYQHAAINPVTGRLDEIWAEEYTRIIIEEFWAEINPAVAAVVEARKYRDTGKLAA